MLKIDEIKLPVEHSFEDIITAVAKALKVAEENLGTWKIIRKSIDARKKPELCYVYSIAVEFKGNEAKKVKQLKNKKVSIYKPEVYIAKKSCYSTKYRPIVMGAGPCGIFAALTLARAGLKPLILERGKPVEERQLDVEDFWFKRDLKNESNVQFGEGGAGAFSDGKLNTGTRDLRHRRIIADFVEAGAPEEICYLAKPHIGSDNLPKVVKHLRELIQSLGGEFRFSTRLTDIIIEDNCLVGIKTEDSQGEAVLECDRLVLAGGHSARDIYRLLYEKGAALAAKPFSLGVRIEHPQELINKVQYGTDALGAADYKLAVHLPDGRGVYTFCMCPGGVVVGAASECGSVVTNGMSAFKRDGTNANSALLVAVTPADFPTDHPLGGMYWQQEIEKVCFQLGGGDYSAPCQLVEDFLANRPSPGFRRVRPTYLPGVKFANLREYLPPIISDSLALALPGFEEKLPGFASHDAVLTAPETRSSAPVRILRDRGGESNIRGIFPAGEGSGYAGGIMSAAADGMRIAELILGLG